MLLSEKIVYIDFVSNEGLHLFKTKADSDLTSSDVKCLKCIKCNQQIDLLNQIWHVNRYHLVFSFILSYANQAFRIRLFIKFWICYPRKVCYQLINKVASTFYQPKLHFLPCRTEVTNPFFVHINPFIPTIPSKGHGQTLSTQNRELQKGPSVLGLLNVLQTFTFQRQEWV